MTRPLRTKRYCYNFAKNRMTFLHPRQFTLLRRRTRTTTTARKISTSVPRRQYMDRDPARRSAPARRARANAITSPAGRYFFEHCPRPCVYGFSIREYAVAVAKIERSPTQSDHTSNLGFSISTSETVSRCFYVESKKIIRKKKPNV